MPVGLAVGILSPVWPRFGAPWDRPRDPGERISACTTALQQAPRALWEGPTMEKLGSLFWSSVTMMALLGIVSSIAAPIALASPIVKITQPAHEQIVQGEIVIDVSYRSDSDQPITRIDLLIDGEVVSQYALAVPRPSGSQAFQWTFTSPGGSKHSLSARAVDAAGEIGMATITVTVAAAHSTGPGGEDRVPPVINIYYPAQGAELSGEVEIRAEASDNVGVKYVFFYIDNKLHKMIMNTGPFVDLWDTTRVADGPHVLQAKAMDERENAAASAEVTVFVRNRDMTAAPGGSLTPAPPAPAIGPQTPEVPAGRLAASDEPMMAMATGAVDASGARVGYVPPIGHPALSARTSQPGRMLVGMPARDPGAAPDGGQAVDAIVSEATSEELDEQMLASAETTPRVTKPRGLEAAGTHLVTPVAEGARPVTPIGPQMASAEGLQRLTMPRTEIERGPGVDGVALQPGWVTLEPLLEVTPDPARTAARTTMPDVSFQPTERLAAHETAPEALVVSTGPQAEFGSMMARIENRITTPERTLGSSEITVAAAPARAEQVAAAPIRSAVEPATPETRVTVPDRRPADTARLSDLSAFRPIEGDTAAMRIAVLPERASRAAIPADGRMTRPGEPLIAPVASMAFGDVAVLFNNETLNLLASPEMKEGISIAPLREIFEHSDGVLYWYPIEKRVRATRPGTDMQLQIGDPRVKVNDETRVLQIAPYIKQGRTMVPLQFLADTLDVTVTFNPDTGQICLTSNEF